MSGETELWAYEWGAPPSHLQIVTKGFDGGGKDDECFTDLERIQVWAVQLGDAVEAWIGGCCASYGPCFFFCNTSDATFVFYIYIYIYFLVVVFIFQKEKKNHLNEREPM